jgi:hydroxymethylpyrimidine pyrophosphatase-like HAD family hydrolase
MRKWNKKTKIAVFIIFLILAVLFAALCWKKRRGIYNTYMKLTGQEIPYSVQEKRRKKYGYYDPENTDDYYIAMKNKTEADCKTILYPLNEAVDVPKWTYHHMELSKKPEIEEILGHKYKGTYHEPVNSVEFVPLGVNKAKGIEVILDHTGISREDSYAFGDSANDIDMIKYVKYGVAMGNSVPELLEIAPYQTARVDEDGIEKGLKKFGLI